MSTQDPDGHLFIAAAAFIAAEEVAFLVPVKRRRKEHRWK
jgi:hypothetical protein